MLATIRVELPQGVGLWDVVADHPQGVRGQGDTRPWVEAPDFCSASSGPRKTSRPAKPLRARSSTSPVSSWRLFYGGFAREPFGDDSREYVFLARRRSNDLH